MSFTTGPIDPSIYTATHTTDDLTHEEQRKGLIDLVNTTFESAGRNLKDFEDTYKSKLGDTHEINDLLLIRHFLLESLEEKNNYLRKHNKQYRMNFSYELLLQFANEDNEYIEENNLLNDDGSINETKLQSHLRSIEKILKTYYPSKKLYIKPEHVDGHLLSVFLSVFYFINLFYRSFMIIIYFSKSHDN